MSSPPKRRLHLTLDLHADDWSALGDALSDVRHAVMIDGSMNATSGGSDAGWHVEVADNPEMTHQAYIDALTEWRAEQQAASGRRPDDG
jgi:hypothetical protein